MTTPQQADETDRPGARTLRVAGKRRALLPPPVASPSPADPTSPFEEEGPSATPTLSAPALPDSAHVPSKALTSESPAPVPVAPGGDQATTPATPMERFLLDPRSAIAAMYADHPDFKMDRNTNYALPLAVRDSIERKSKTLGVPIKQVVAAMLLAALETWKEPVQTWML